MAEGNADIFELEDFVFNLEVIAINGEYSSREFVSIYVDDVNEFAPEFQTSDTVVLTEGATGGFTVSASDEDGGNLLFFPEDIDQNRSDFVASDIVYTISGGADAALFILDPTIRESGALESLAALVSFIDLPTIDSPTDADGDGVYEIEITASDGELETTQIIQVSLVEAGDAPVFSLPVKFDIDESLDFVSLTDVNIVAIDPCLLYTS